MMNTSLTLNFPVKDLIGILEKNKEQHQKLFKEAKEAYKKALIVELEGKVEEFKGKIEKVQDGESPGSLYYSTSLRPPKDHTKSYTNAIEMFKMTTDEVILLDAPTFAAYVRDKWGWQKEFLETSMSNMRALSTINGLDAEVSVSGSVCGSYFNDLYGDDE